MKIALGSDADGYACKETVKRKLEAQGYEIFDTTPDPGRDCVEAAGLVCRAVQAGEAERGVLFDAYGSGSFMAACKYKGIVCAQLADEYSSLMTRRHNNTCVISVGTQLSGPGQIEALIDSFLRSGYDGGRHQVRVDMLNKMC